MLVDKSQGKFITAILLVAILTMFSNTVLFSQNPKNSNYIDKDLKWSEKMALSIIKRHPEAWQMDNNEKLKWDYKTGLVLTAFQRLSIASKNPIYDSYIKEYAEMVIDSSGNILNVTEGDHNIDMINAGKILFKLYADTKEERYIKAIHKLGQKLKVHPRTQSGGFWHKAIYPNQMWLDGLYMGAPFYAQYTAEYQNGENLNDVAKQFEEIQKHTFDPKTGLFFHAWDESKKMPWANSETGTSPNFWSRAIGWYVMALVDVLDYFPKTHPKRPELIKFLNQAAEGIAKYQDQSGLWYQVMDQGNRRGNYLEASGSCMFTYAFVKGADKGYLPSKYKKIAEKSFDAILKNFIKIDNDGEVHITQVCGSAGLGGNPYRDGSYEYYINEKIKIDNSHGTGPFILAALELDK